MKRYRRIIIIFMLVVINVWVTKSSDEEPTLETFIETMKEYAQDGGYLLSKDEVNSIEQYLNIAKKKLKMLIVI